MMFYNFLPNAVLYAESEFEYNIWCFIIGDAVEGTALPTKFEYNIWCFIIPG